MSQVSLVRTALWGLVLVLLVAAGGLFFVSTQRAAEAAYGTPFALTDQTGAPVTRESLKGESSAVFFGYTHCPDVCPTTLFELAGYQKELKAEGKDFRIVFVTVDPARDTPQTMKSYVDAFGADVTAITGAPYKIAAMLDGWGIYARKIGDGSDYTMDHTAKTLLLDANGALAGTLAYQEPATEAKARLEALAG